MSEQSRLYNLLKRPLLSEKSNAINEKLETGESKLRKYPFEVDKNANKLELRRAFELAFPGSKVTAVHVLKVPGGTKRMGRKTARTAGWRKAIFTVSGEPIQALTQTV